MPPLTFKKREDPVRGWRTLRAPALAIALTLLVSAALLAARDFAPLPLFYAFFIDPLTTQFGIAEVLMRGAALIVIALGLTVGFRANVWNIGAEGQLTMGAICGGGAALALYGVEAWFVLPLMLLAGVAGGAAWAAIPAWLRTRFHTSEILVSLMLVYIAALLLSYLVHGPLRDPDGFNFPQSRPFHDAALFPTLWAGTRLSLTALFPLVVLPVVYLLLARGYFGFQLRVAGLAPRAARYAGFSDTRMVWSGFLVSGGLAGLIGVSEVAANVGQLTPTVSPGYGFTAIIVAFLGRLHPLGILFSGLLLALISIGAESAQIDLGLPVSMGGIFQGLILFCLLAAEFFLTRELVWRAPAGRVAKGGEKSGGSA